MNVLPIKSAIAWAPVAMSLVALSIVLYHAARFGLVHEADECTAAHLFQMLMAAQLPLVAFFALRWLPERPRETMQVLALQALAGIVAFAAVYCLT